MKIALITVFIYSALLTAVLFYKDISHYSSGGDNIDIVFAGPVMWLWLLLGYGIILPVHKLYKKHHPAVKEKKIKHYSKKKIQRIVKRIVAIHKYDLKKYKLEKDTITLDKFFHHCFDHDEIITPGELVVKKAKYEWINRKFHHAYYNQREDTIEALMPYLAKWNIEDYKKGDFNNYWIDRYKNAELWYLK